MAARGPRGWVRPDAHILDELCERIVRGGVDASGLTLDVEGGHVWLEGEVALREERRFLLDLAERVLGVRGVYAEVRVLEDEAEHPEPAGAPGEDGPTWH